MEFSAEVEVPILTGRKLREIDRVIGWNEPRDGGLDRGVEQTRLGSHNHVPQPLQRGHYACHARACRCQF